MRRARMLVPKDWDLGHYHVISRIVDKQRLLGPNEKRHFISYMREYEVFCGVKVLTFTVPEPDPAGIEKDPKDYAWSGYGEAMGGNVRAREGLRTVVRAVNGGQEVAPEEVLPGYRVHLYQEGSEERETIGEVGEPVRGTLRREEVKKVVEAKGRLPLGSYLKCRVRYFVDGAVLGGKEFVEKIFQFHRSRFGPRRKNGARRLRGVEDMKEGRLFCVRDLKLRVIE